MMRQRHGRIINISSIAAEHANPGQANYAASKGAINALTRALAVELASRNVTVNAVAPGFIETDMTQAVRNKAGDMSQENDPHAPPWPAGRRGSRCGLPGESGECVHHRTSVDR